MRFFKYLIFIILSLFSINTFAAKVYKHPLSSTTYQTQEAACSALVGLDDGTGKICAILFS